MTSGPEPAGTGLRIAVVGLGGTGQRHLRILRGLLGWEQEWLGIRRRGTTPVLDAAFRPQPGSMADAYRLRLFDSLSAALDKRPDLVVVATPTALHTEAVLAAVAAGCPVLVAKPLAATAEEAAAIVAASRDAATPVFAGFQRRHHPAWRETMRHVTSGSMGSLTAAHMWTASDVTAWHPYEPIEDLYAVRADLGGGVVATECHEVDQLVGLLGAPDTVDCSGPPTRPGEVERSAELLLTWDQLPAPAQVSVSFEATEPRRGWELVCTDGVVAWDEVAGTLTVERPGRGTEVTSIEAYGNDDLVAVQDRWVLEHRHDLGAAATALAQAQVVSEVIAAARRSLRTGAGVALDHAE